MTPRELQIRQHGLVVLHLGKPCCICGREDVATFEAASFEGDTRPPKFICEDAASCEARCERRVQC